MPHFVVGGLGDIAETLLDRMRIRRRISYSTSYMIQRDAPFAATLLLRDRTGVPLGPDHEAEQSRGAIYGQH